MTHFIQTASGRKFDLLNPENSEFVVEDIAHALSHLCRFNGATRHFYSVGQHSVMVSKVVPPALALAGLLHDAAEAFMGDVATPLKTLLPEYKVLEEKVEAVVLQRFGLPPRLPPEIKAADLVLLATEKRDLLTVAQQDSTPWPILEGVEPLPEVLRPWSAPVARRLFLQRYYEIVGRSKKVLLRAQVW